MTLFSKGDVPIVQLQPTPTDAFWTLHASGRSASESCARVKELGFSASKHIKIYGQRYELVSDPFEDGSAQRFE